MKTKPFNLEAAKAGKPVVLANKPTRITIIDWGFLFGDKSLGIVCKYPNPEQGYTNEILHTCKYDNLSEHFRMEVEVKTQWVNTYKVRPDCKKHLAPESMTFGFRSELDSRNNANIYNPGSDYLLDSVAVPVEVEV
jgi:hypothetical protein